MLFTLTDFQQDAVQRIIQRVKSAQSAYADSGELAAVVLTAPTGAGKTVIATAVIEQLMEGGDFTDPIEDSTILWVTNDPSLNAQTLQKMEAASDKLGGLAKFHTITGGSGINQVTFDPGGIYFLNVQAARTGALITRHSDNQRYTIWETIENTIDRYGSSLIVVIDEAHIGVGAKPNAEDQTIVNKIINGPKPVPVVIGISATSDKFNKSLEQLVDGEARSKKPVTILVDDVQKSGLIKDFISLHNPDDNTKADTTLIRVGVKRTREMESAWAAYAVEQGEKFAVKPAMIVQVANTPTSTQLREIVDAIVDEWPGLSYRAIVHTFAEHTPIDLEGGVILGYMPPQMIQDHDDIRVVIAKNAITTGWDCPRAEVLVSLRTVAEHTTIAQLIGRTVRQPLARRIDSNESLNKVYCFLPNFDSAGVQKVINEFLPNGEQPTPIVVTRASIEYRRDSKQDLSIAAFAELPTYVVPSKSSTTNTKRLSSLAMELEGSGLYSGAVHEARRLINLELDNQVNLLPDGALETRRDEVSKVMVSAQVVTTSGQIAGIEDVAFGVKLDVNNIDDVFAHSARRFKDGVAERYWQYLTGDDMDGATEHKITVAALGTFPSIVESVQKRAGEIVNSWMGSYGKAISDLPDAARAPFDRIESESPEPTLTRMIVPTLIEEAVSVSGDSELSSDEIKAKVRGDIANRYGKHIYIDSFDEQYFAPLNGLEASLVNMEISATAVAWYRNPTSGRRALRIPYVAENGRWASLYPDFIFFHDVAGVVKPSIVDPHGQHLEDSKAKLRGLVLYAQTHFEHYRSINPLIEMNGIKYCLALQVQRVRGEVLKALDEGIGIESIFTTYGDVYTA